MLLKHLNSAIVLLLLLFSSFVNPSGRRWSSNDSGFFFFFYVFSKRERKAEPQFQTLQSPFESEPRKSSHLYRAKMNPERTGHQKVVAYFCCHNVSRQQQRRAFTVRARHRGLANGRRHDSHNETTCQRLASPRSKHNTLIASVQRRVQSKPVEESHCKSMTSTVSTRGAHHMQQASFNGKTPLMPL